MTLRDQLAALTPAPAADATERARLVRERHRLKAAELGKLPSFAGRSWSFGSYKVIVVSGPRNDPVERAVAFTLRLERNGVDVTPEQWKPDVAWRNPPVESDDLQAALLAVLTVDLRDAVARLAYAPAPPPPPPTGAFLSWPASDAVYIGTKDPTYDVVIEKKSFRGLNTRAIVLQNVRRALIRDCDFDNCATNIYCVDCEEITVTDIRSRGITGPFGHLVQFDKVQGGYVARIKNVGGNTEDLISMYMSNGTQAKPLIVEDVASDGTGWTSATGSGVMLGDGGGSWQIARRLSLLNPGQVGAAIAGGTHHAILDSTIKGEQLPKSNVGIYVAKMWGGPFTDHELSGNTVEWLREDGVENPVSSDGAKNPDGTSVLIVRRANSFYGPGRIDSAKLRVVL